ncbi:preprotein translocase subunit SecE [Patescibacteria group bacterium]
MKKVLDFIKGAYAEFQKVTWPTKKETRRLTLYVLGVSLGVALFVWGADLLFNKLLSTIIL